MLPLVCRALEPDAEARFRPHRMDDPVPTYSKAPFSLHRFVGLQQTKTQKQQLLAMGLRDPVDDKELPPPMDDYAVVNTQRGAVKVCLPSDHTLPVHD